MDGRVPQRDGVIRLRNSSSGLPHPRAYGNAVRVIALYVKERHVLTLEEAVRKMTSWPATRYRLAGRGMIREGNWADIVLFDLEKVRDLAEYKDPHHYPVGIPYVLVNGVIVINEGWHTGKKAGMALRHASSVIAAD